ncbi:MAG: FAD:protein FMN transferase [Actinomycetota bacterium]
MGSTAEIIAVGCSHGEAIEEAVQRVDQLERRWSRFIDTSEVSVLNHRAGTPVPVSEETMLLVELGCDGWARTDGRFDPTVLHAVEANGYSVSFDRMADTAAVARPRPAEVAGCDSIVIDRSGRTVRLPPDGGFDPGGIGKGLAADLVGHRLRAAGVESGCVSIGGDLRIWGLGPAGRRWRIGTGGRTIEITDVGIATSGSQRRAWELDGDLVNHLIDPSTLRSTTAGPVAVTVVAGSAWQAETYATALMVTPPASIPDDLERWGVVAFLTRTS